jgi:hypothetical protein
MVILFMKLGSTPRQSVASPSPLVCSYSQKGCILSPLFATLTHSASRKSFPCHSLAPRKAEGYENTRVAYPKSERRAKVSFPLPNVPTLKPSNVPTSVLISPSFLALLHSRFEQHSQNQHVTSSFRKTPGMYVPKANIRRRSALGTLAKSTRTPVPEMFVPSEHRESRDLSAFHFPAFSLPTPQCSSRFDVLTFQPSNVLTSLESTLTQFPSVSPLELCAFARLLREESALQERWGRGAKC